MADRSGDSGCLCYFDLDKEKNDDEEETSTE
jgi:hypothetical protein